MQRQRLKGFRAQVEDGRWLPKEFLVQHGGFDGWSAEQLRDEEQVRTAAPASTVDGLGLTTLALRRSGCWRSSL